ncbi:MAG: hypothetical protein ABIR59_04460, partial [Gemmatimonadales bacterium]
PTPDPLTLDSVTFVRELTRRFKYPAPPQPGNVTDRGAGQSLDADYFASFLEFDRSYSDAARRDATVKIAKLRAEAAGLSHEAFVLRVAEIAALADNAHTAINGNAFHKNTPRIPLRAYWFADRLHVLRTSPALRDLLGAQIERIAGLPVAEVLGRLQRYAGGTDNHRKLVLTAVFESPALLNAAGIGNDGHALLVDGRLADGTPFSRRIEADDRGPAAPVSATARLLFPLDVTPEQPFLSFRNSTDAPTLFLKDSRELFSIAPMENGGLYVGLDHNTDGDNQPIAPFLQRVIDTVQAGDVRFVVVDMRMNGGGDYTKTYRFAHELVKALPAPRRIYVLTSGWTFSAAITTLAALKDSGGERVVIIGEEIGDRLHFWAEGSAFVLPNSNIAVSYATGRHNYQGPCTDRDQCFWLNYMYPVRVRTLVPDIAAPFTFRAYQEGRDPAIEAVLRHEGR